MHAESRLIQLEIALAHAVIPHRISFS